MLFKDNQTALEFGNTSPLPNQLHFYVLILEETYRRGREILDYSDYHRNH